jgi:hypothetical protein
MKASHMRAATSVSLLVAAGLLLWVGSHRTIKVYDSAVSQFGWIGFTRISEAQLVEDATCGGVARKGGKLTSTYDHTTGRGKRACPS